jgi:hypothetical protein
MVPADGLSNITAWRQSCGKSVISILLHPASPGNSPRPVQGEDYGTCSARREVAGLDEREIGLAQFSKLVGSIPSNLGKTLWKIPA